MKPERIQIVQSIERWELVPPQGRISLPCESARAASILAGAAAYLAEKLGLAGLVATTDQNHVVVVSFEVESHQGFTAREQGLSERIEDLWFLLTDQIADET